MNPNETRSSHPSSAQVETLIEFMERNPGMAKGFLRTQKCQKAKSTPVGGTSHAPQYYRWHYQNLQAVDQASRHIASVASPSHRPRTVCGSRGGSVSSRHTSSVAAPPPSQRRTSHREIPKGGRTAAGDTKIKYTDLAVLSGEECRDKILAEAVAAVGKGLQALAEANRDSGCSSISRVLVFKVRFLVF